MDIDRYLGEFEAATPSPELRRRVLDHARRPRRGGGGGWAAAAAAAFLVFANLAIEARLGGFAGDSRAPREQQRSLELDRVAVRFPVRSASGRGAEGWYRQQEEFLEATP